jgi:cell division protein FtsQ
MRRRHHERRQGTARSSWVDARMLVALALGVGIFSLVGWGLGLLLDPHALPVRVVQVKGRLRYLTSMQLQKSVAGAATGGILSVDMGEVERHAQVLPWVDRVTVRRVWPDALTLVVIEQIPVARWGERELLNGRGERFTPKPEEIPDALPHLFGPPGTERGVLQRYRDLADVLEPYALAIERLQMSERRAVTLSLADGPEIRLGRTGAAERLRRFARAYAVALKGRSRYMSRVDLRYTNGFSVQWREQSLAAGEEGSGYVGGVANVEEA